MSRLIAFGCSFTYGHGLEDCIVFPHDPGPVASKTAWPNSLGKLLKVDEIINQSLPGASNKLIWKTIVDFNFKQDDLVFINWTDFNRHCFFRNNIEKATGAGFYDDLHIGSWIKDKSSKSYYKYLYSELDSTLEFLNRADHSKRYLDSLNIKNFHTIQVYDLDRNALTIPKWASVNLLKPNMSTISALHPKALDNSHPGQLAHDQFANDLYLEIKEMR